MKKIAPSQLIRKEIEAAIQEGAHEGDILSWLERKSVQRVIQEALEQEATDYLGRERYSRDEPARHGYRNGYETKSLKTAEGEIPLSCPQLRGTAEPYRSTLL